MDGFLIFIATYFGLQGSVWRRWEGSWILSWYQGVFWSPGGKTGGRRSPHPGKAVVISCVFTHGGLIQVATQVLRGGSSYRDNFQERLIKVYFLIRQVVQTVFAMSGALSVGRLQGMFWLHESSDETKLRPDHSPFISDSSNIWILILIVSIETLLWVESTPFNKVNVLIDSEGNVIVADYSLASIIDTSDFTSKKTAGTCRWTAPEIMDPPNPNDDDVTLNYSHKEDRPESSYPGQSQNVNALADLYYFGWVLNAA